ncbi:unnamed protein product [Cyclocybe aegerita]|uniref:Uncharacterized protein n=1 Tax=Cyclocybe aegerita TaxID=1973307 RepID=A0A8S0W0X1_CYCAE|nr:unnamed protein product [Cyclocybe aegerita]
MYPKKIPARMTLADACAVAEPIHCSMAEVEPGWSYKTKSLEDIYRGDKGVLDYHGKFLTDTSKHTGNQLIRQVCRLSVVPTLVEDLGAMFLEHEDCLHYEFRRRHGPPARSRRLQDDSLLPPPVDRRPRSFVFGCIVVHDC